MGRTLMLWVIKIGFVLFIELLAAALYQDVYNTVWTRWYHLEPVSYIDSFFSVIFLEALVMLFILGWNCLQAYLGGDS